jgi:hypothetical protein
MGKLPESTYGMFFSTFLTGSGIYFWLKSYKEKRGYYPKFYKIYRDQIDSMKKNLFNGIFFLIRHLLKFYTLILVFSMILVSIGYLTIGQSEPVKVTQNFCEKNQEIAKITGHINHYNILRSVHSQWNSKTGNSEISMIFVSEKGIFDVYSKLVKKNSEWKVKELELTNKNNGTICYYNGFGQ